MYFFAQPFRSEAELEYSADSINCLNANQLLSIMVVSNAVATSSDDDKMMALVDNLFQHFICDSFVPILPRR